MNRRSAAAAVLMASTLAATVVACAPQATAPEGPRSITIAVASGTLDVNFTDTSKGGFLFYPTTQAVYEPLIRRDTVTGQHEGVLASEFVVSDDAKRIDFTIRDGVAFTDGEELTAEAVAQVLDVALNDTASWSSYLQPKFGTEVSFAGNVVTITATTPLLDPTFLDSIEFIPIVSPAALDGSYGDDPYPGTGPYLVDEVVPESSVSFVQNPDYWNPGAVSFDTVTFRAYSDPVAGLNALKSGQVDVSEVDLLAADEAESGGLTIHEGQYLIHFIDIIDLGGELAPALGDARVRQAMNLAFDREEIAETLGAGFGRVSSQPFVPGGRPTYVEGGDERYSYDPDEARALLADAGFADGFTLQIGSYQGHPSQMYEPIITQSLADIGITVDWKVFPDGAALGEGAAGPNGEMLIPAILIAGNTDQPVLMATDKTQMARIDDPVWNELVDAYFNGTTSEFEETSRRVGEYIVENALYVAYAQDPELWASAPGIEIVFPPVGVTFIRLADISVAD